MPVNNVIKLRRGTDWSSNPVLAQGEPGFDTTNNILKIGDGTTAWSVLNPIGSGLDYLQSHPNISAASSSNNSGRTYIQDILLDNNGHVIGITTATESGAVTETNDLSSSVTWVNVPDANITESSVIQHSGALRLTESQIVDLQNYLTSFTETNDLSSAVTWANVPDTNITASSVVQHTGSLQIKESQIVDLQTYLTSFTETNDLSSAVTWANVPDSNITQSSVVQHTGALRITESQIVDLQNYLTSHPTIGSAASSSDNSGRTYIQDILLDSNGHVIGITTATETVTDTNTEYTAGTGLSLSSTEFSVNPDLINSRTEVTSTDSDYLLIWDATDSQLKKVDAGEFRGGGDIVDDTTPQLGGNLDINSKNVTGAGHIDITGSGHFSSLIRADSFIKDDGTSSQFLKADGSVDSSTYLTSFTETNDLSAAVVWANVPDANITESSVVQHTGAFRIKESQVVDLQSYLTSETFTSVVQDTTPELGGNLDVNGKDIIGSGDISTTGHIILQETMPNHCGIQIKSSGDVDGGLHIGSCSDANGVPNAMGLRHSSMDGSNDFMICANTDGATFVSAKDTKTLTLTGGGNDSGARLRLNTSYGFRFNENKNASIDLRYSGYNETNLFYIDSSTDSIGVGTDSPARKLHVVGDIEISGTIYQSGTIFQGGGGGSTLTEEQVEDFVGGMVTGNTETGITVTYQDADGTLDFVVASQTDENFTTADHSKLDGIEASADVTDTANVTSAGALMDSELTDLAGVKGVTISTLQVKPSEGAFVDGDKTKLDAIEASADVTDTTNVTAAGALMDSEVTNLSQVKAFDSSDYATAAQGTKADSAQQPPSEGAFANGDKTKLDGIEANATADQTDEEIQDIVGAMLTSNTETGITVTYQDADGTIDFAVSSQTDENFTTADHSKLDGIEASADVTDATNVDAAGAVMNSDTSTASMSFVVDEDNMSSDSNTKVPTQQSVKAYIDGGGFLTAHPNISAADSSDNSGNTFIQDITLDSNGHVTALTTATASAGGGGGIGNVVEDTTPQLGGNLDLNSKNLTGTGHIDITGSGHFSSLVRADSFIKDGGTSSQFLKADGSVDTNTYSTTDTQLTEEQVEDFVGGMLTGNTETGITVTYQDADGTIDFVVASQTDENFTTADHSKLDGIEASADVTDTANVTSAGALMDSEVTNLSEVKAFASSDYATAAQGTKADSAQQPPSEGAFANGDKTKLDGIEASADVTDTANVTSAGALMDSELTDLAGVKGVTISTLQVKPSEGAFANGDKTKLDGIEASATADQTDEEIQDIVGAMLSSNTETGITVTYQDADGTIDFVVASQTDENFTTADHSKLDGIEASADVTDTANVTSAGALMDSELTDLAGVKGVTISTLQVKPSEGAFANGDKTKLDGIEASATADQTDEEIQDIVGAMVSSNTETGITVTYQDADGTLDFVVDHDAASNFVANEHIDHTSVTLTAGDGLTGGGDISANRTFAVSVDDSTIEINSDALRIKDAAITPAKIGVGTFVFNEAGANYDFRVEGDSDENLLFVDASKDSVIIGNSSDGSLNSKLHVYEVANTNTTNSRTVNILGRGYSTTDGTYYHIANNSRAEKYLSASTTDAGYCIGVNAVPVIYSPDGTNALAEVTALRANASINTAASNVTVTNAYDIKTVPYFQGTNNTVTNHYGLYLGDAGAGGTTPTNEYGVYQVNTAATNYFGGTLDVRGAAVFNEGGGNFDFRVEGDTQANLLVCDASTDRVGIGTDSPSVELEVDGNMILDKGSANRPTKIHGDSLGFISKKGDSGGWQFSIDAIGASDTVYKGFGFYGSADTLNSIWIGGAYNTPYAKFTTTETVLNENGADRDLRVEGDTDTDLLLVDAGNDIVQIGKLNINGAFTLPTADGSANQILKTDGNGAVSWAADGGGGGGGGSMTTVKANGSQVGGADIVTLDFASDFTVAETPDTEVNISIADGAISSAKMTTSTLVLNEAGAAVDFRVEGDTDTHLLFVDGSADKVGIGLSTPTEKLDVDGNIKGGIVHATSGLNVGVSGLIHQSGTFVHSTEAAWGEFPGNAQNSINLLTGETTNATFTSLQMNNGMYSGVKLPSNKTFFADVNIVGRRTNASNSTSQHAAYQLKACINNDGFGRSVIGSVGKTVVAESNSAWDVQLAFAGAGSGQTDYLLVQCKGAASTNVHWVAKVDLLEVGGLNEASNYREANIYSNMSPEIIP